MTSATKLKEIFEIQVGLLHDKAQFAELDQEDIKKLETLTRAWKTFNSTEVKKTSSDEAFKDMTVEQLLKLASKE